MVRVVLLVADIYFEAAVTLVVISYLVRVMHTNNSTAGGGEGGGGLHVEDCVR